MPYITGDRRNVIDVGADKAKTAGELNYAITRLVDEYAHRAGLNYAAINDVLGALEGAKLEFYRRVAAPYEETKIAANGDVYNVG